MGEVRQNSIVPMVCVNIAKAKQSLRSILLVIEHIQPVSRGGKTISENLALSCQTCNNYKYTQTEAPDPITDQIVSLFHPHQMIWQQHFTWSEDLIQMIGITPVGRATIALLQTNRDGVVNMRRVLIMMGYHPPG
jgi:HNH endonuclease